MAIRLNRCFLILIFIFIVWPANRCLSKTTDTYPAPINDAVQITAIDKTGDKSVFLGTTTGLLTDYAIIEEPARQKLFLYKKGDYINNEFEVRQIYGDYLMIRPQNSDKKIILAAGAPYEGFKFLRSVDLYRFEYWYRINRKNRKDKDNRFELIGIQGYGAILAKDYNAGPINIDNEDALIKVAEENRVDSNAGSADEIFFNQMLSKYMGDNVWIIDGKSVTVSAVNNAAKAFIDVTKKVRAIGFSPKSGLKLRVSSKTISGVLDADGFRADSLGPGLRQKTGLFPGDIIKSVNGKNVSSMLGLILILLDVKKDNIKEVTVDIVRNNKPLKLTYLIS